MRQAQDLAQPRRPQLGRDLQATVQDGQRAKTQLVWANLGLVVAVAQRYLGRGLDLPDLIQEGNLGLIRAVDKFDPTLGYRLSRYAFYPNPSRHHTSAG